MEVKQEVLSFFCLLPPKGFTSISDVHLSVTKEPSTAGWLDSLVNSPVVLSCCFLPFPGVEEELMYCGNILGKVKDVGCWCCT